MEFVLGGEFGEFKDLFGKRIFVNRQNVEFIQFAKINNSLQIGLKSGTIFEVQGFDELEEVLKWWTNSENLNREDC